MADIQREGMKWVQMGFDRRTEGCDWSIRYLFCEWLCLLCRCSRWRPAGSRSLRCDGPVLERWRAAWVSAPPETWWCHFLRCSRQTALVGNGEKRQLLIWDADRLETEVRGQTQDRNRSETGLNEWVIRRERDQTNDPHEENSWKRSWIMYSWK